MSKHSFAPLVLASTSPYRRTLLERIGLPFETHAPAVDESALAGEDPAELAARLALSKASAGAAERPQSVVIGSDQVACLGASTLGKPASAERAAAQLRAASGREVTFLTAVCVVAPSRDAPLRHLDVTRVVFRELDEDEITRYVAADRPFDCAGGFKAERLGIALFERVDARDPTGLIGLPLIWVTGALRSLGYPVP